jgi:hypothetical protein
MNDELRVLSYELRVVPIPVRNLHINAIESGNENDLTMDLISKNSSALNLFTHHSPLITHDPTHKIRNFFLFLNKFFLVRKTFLILFIYCLLPIVNCLFPIANCLLPIAYCQTYWQQQVNYTIDVTLNDKEHTLDAFTKIEYINNSTDTLKFIWFHLWPNAYKNDKTAFSDQQLENGATKFYFSDKEARGYINRLDFKINNITAITEDHPEHIDIVKLVLPNPLPPGEKITISTPFHVKLANNFSRGGHVGQSYQVTQWYPKPAVYDKYGWHPIPYLDQGEFYSDFGNFDVRITLPKNYVVAATGELTDEKEKEWMRSRDSSVVTHELKNQSTLNKDKNFPSALETKTVQYIQNNVHDFAWFADKRFIVDHDTLRLVSGRIIDAYSFYNPDEKQIWQNSISFIKDAIRTRSEWIGEYPYNVVSAVGGPQGFAGGMEYPTITIITSTESALLLDEIMAHEIGHNWFYGVLASNERKHPWMDEGMNTYYDNRYHNWKYENKSSVQLGPLGGTTLQKAEKLLFDATAAVKKDQPIATPGEKFTIINYNLVAYYKTGAWLEVLERSIGKSIFDKGMQEYYRQWQFRHPYPEDFKKVMEETSGKNLDSIFRLLSQKGNLPGEARVNSSLVFFPGKKYISTLMNGTTRNLFTISLVPGFNSYDRFMAGLVLTNMKLPASNFQFLVIPMYATGSKRFVGLGKLIYSIYPDHNIRKVDLFMNGSTFTQDMFTDSSGNKLFFSFSKIVPGIRLTMKNRDQRSTVNKYIQWKSFFISEDGLRFSRDSIFNGVDTVIIDKFSKVSENRTLHQLKLVVENFRALYPFSAEIKIEEARDFVRAAFTGNYFFNYPGSGGLQTRLFGGKFFYKGSKTTTKQFTTDRYHLNMTGPNGAEDYTYSDYFLGRNKFEGFASQQIMVRDGGFKIRTDLLAAKVGKTDNWLAAANFSTTIPSRINPLSVLPVKIPLKIFLDIGTYATAWEPDSELDRFLFDAGLQIPLLKETFNIYIPIIYSRVFKDYIQSTISKKNRLFKTISFTIDLSGFELKRSIQKVSFLW